jgi:hypothetical protein
MAFENNVQTTLHANLAIGATTMEVAKSAAPNNDVPESGKLTLTGTDKVEIISYAGRTDATTHWTLTGVTKNAESNFGDQAWSAGDTVYQALTAGDVQELRDNAGTGTVSYALFEYTVASNGQVDFTGVDINGNTLEYTPDSLTVIRQGFTLPSSDYTATDGTTVSISAGTLQAGESVIIQAFGVAGGGTTVYDTLVELPLADNDQGAMAYVAEDNRLYLWRGTRWWRVELKDDAPTVTPPPPSIDLPVDGTPYVLTITSLDPEGEPLTWSYEVTSGSLGETTITNVGDDFTITPSTNNADRGDFTVAFSVTDGQNTVINSVDFTLNLSEFVMIATGQYHYTGAAVHTFTELMQVRANEVDTDIVSQTSFHLKYDIYDGIGSTKTVIAKVDAPSTSTIECAQSAFESFGEAGIFYSDNSGNSTTQYASAQTYQLNYVNDDNDGSFMAADGSCLAAQGNYTQLNQGFYFQITSDSPGSHYVINKSSPFVHSDQSVGNGMVIPFPAVGGEVIFNFNTNTYQVNNGPIRAMSTLAYSMSDLMSDNSAGMNNSRVMVTDQIGQAFVGMPTPGAQKASSLVTAGYLFDVDWDNQTLVNLISATNFNILRWGLTEEDPFGDVLFAVDAKLTFIGPQSENSSNHSDARFRQVYGNWKTVDMSIGTGSLNVMDHVYPCTASSNQAGADAMAMIDSENIIWYADWGHDAGGLFNIGEDSSLNFARSNIRMIKSDMY